MAVFMGMANRMVVELATRCIMSVPHEDRHVNGRSVMHGTVQRLQVRVCCDCGRL